MTFRTFDAVDSPVLIPLPNVSGSFLPLHSRSIHGSLEGGGWTGIPKVIRGQMNVYMLDGTGQRSAT